MSNLKLLNEAFEKLSKAKNLDDLIRRSVIALKAILKFDRAGFLVYDPNHYEQHGTWGTDADGNLRAEHGYKAPVTDNLITRTSEDRIRVVRETTLQELGKPVCNGWHLQAAVFSGEQLFGWLFVDNLVNHQEINDEQIETITAFSNVLGQLIVRSKMEDTLLEALDTLAANEDITSSALEKVEQLEAQHEGNRRMVVLAERLSGLIPMSSRAVGNLVNFISLLSPEKFDSSDLALLDSAKKSADQLSRTFRYFDTKVHEATDNDIQTLQASVIQDYWFNHFQSFYRNTPHHIEVKTEHPNAQISLPLILLTQLVKELVLNSLHHGLEQCESGRTLITLKDSERALRISVEDSGTGLDEDQFRDVLKLFVTSKPNEHLGSGLNVIQHYVERWLNGQLDLRTSELGGLCCTLVVPIHNDEHLVPPID